VPQRAVSGLEESQGHVRSNPASGHRRGPSGIALGGKDRPKAARPLSGEASGKAGTGRLATLGVSRPQPDHRCRQGFSAGNEVAERQLRQQAAARFPFDGGQPRGEEIAARGDEVVESGLGSVDVHREAMMAAARWMVAA
jgi:hypothetical protein